MENLKNSLSPSQLSLSRNSQITMTENIQNHSRFNIAYQLEGFQINNTVSPF